MAMFLQTNDTPLPSLQNRKKRKKQKRKNVTGLQNIGVVSNTYIIYII